MCSLLLGGTLCVQERNMLLSDGNLAAVELHDTLKVESQRRCGKGLERAVQANLDRRLAAPDARMGAGAA